jgi:hypothetical protein
MLGSAIITVGSVLVVAAMLICALVALMRRANRSGDPERLLDRDWWPRFERQFAEYVERLSEGRRQRGSGG